MRIAILSALLALPTSRVSPAAACFDAGQDAWDMKIVGDWLVLGSTHSPGATDPSLSRARSLRPEDLYRIQIDFDAILQFLAQPSRTRLQQPQRVYDAAAIQSLSRMAAELTDAKLKHIATLSFDNLALAGGPPFLGEFGLSTSVSVSLDGVSRGQAIVSPHWVLANSAVRAMAKRAANREWLQKWYRATSAYLFAKRQFASLPEHLDNWKRDVPDDPGEALYEGCLYEAYASDRIQRVIEEGEGRPYLVPKRHQALGKARDIFTSVTNGPEIEKAEAALRLTRVKWLLDDGRRTVEDLLSILPKLESDQALAYYGLLFLGLAQQTENRPNDAISAFEKAHRLYPTAQSPVIALGILQGETSTPSFRDKFLNLGEGDSDPWFAYHLGPGRRLSTLLTSFWQDSAGS